MAHHQFLFVAAFGIVIGAPIDALVQQTAPQPAQRCIEQFLAIANERRATYRAVRRLEASGGGRTGWMEAWTEVSAGGGFRYGIVAEGGSESVRTRVLRAALEREKRYFDSALTHIDIDIDDYTWTAAGPNDTGLIKVAFLPRRQNAVFSKGDVFLRPDDGELVRVEGRLAKSPSFWVTDIDLVRNYARINGALVPVVLEATGKVRMAGPSFFRMTYDYTSINDRPVPSRTLELVSNRPTSN